MKRKRSLQVTSGLVVSLAFALLALRGVSFSDLRQALGRVSWIWLVPALATLGLSLWLRSERWRALFVRDVRPSSSATFWAMNVGYLCNNVLPARAGELARVLALGRETGISRTHILVTVVVERVFDLASVAVVMLACVWVMPDRGFVNLMALIAAIVLGGTAAVVAALSIRPLRGWCARQVRRLPVGAARIEHSLGALALGLAPLRDLSLAVPVVLWSLASWGVLTVSYWCVLHAVVPSAPWDAAVLALVATNFVQVLPSSAGALGIFEVAAKKALTVYGVSPAVALSYALVLHAVNYLPFIVLGSIGIARLGLTRRQFTSDLLHPEAEGAAEGI